MRFLCRACPGGACAFRVPGPTGPRPFEPDAGPRWHEPAAGRSPADPPGAAGVPGPFCAIPARVIARATASRDRYTIEIGGADRLEIPVSRAAFREAVRAMEADDGRR